MKRWCKICKGMSNESLMLHSFPVHEEMKKKWADFCNEKVKDLTGNSRLCSLHFEPAAFRTAAEKEKSKRLTACAVPTLFGPLEVSKLYGSTTNIFPKIIEDDFNESEPDDSNDSVNIRTDKNTSGKTLSTVQAYFTRKGKYPRSLNDLKTSDCGKSKEAKMILEIARKDLDRLRQRHRKLALDNLRLHKRISSLEEEMQELEDQDFEIEQSSSDTSFDENIIEEIIIN